MIPNPNNEAKTDQEFEKTDPEEEVTEDDKGEPNEEVKVNGVKSEEIGLKLLDELRNLRSRAGIRVSMVIGYDGAILGIHEDAAYVPKVLRKGPHAHARSSKIDTKYFGKWSTSIHRTIEFVSESLFESGVKFILLEGTDQTKAIIVNMKQELNKGKSFLLVGILPTKGTVGLAYQEMKDSAERITKILQENSSCQ